MSVYVCVGGSFIIPRAVLEQHLVAYVISSADSTDLCRQTKLS